MQWIAQKNQACDARSIAGNVGGDTPTHRFTTNDEPFWTMVRNHSFDHAPVPGLKLWLRIRHTALPFHVFKLKFHREEAVLRQFGMKVTHKWRMHSLTGAMGKNNSRAVIPGLRFFNFK